MHEKQTELVRKSRGMQRSWESRDESRAEKMAVTRNLTSEISALHVSGETVE